AEAGERTVHEPRIDRAQALVVSAEALHHTRTKAFHDHIGGLRELFQQLFPTGRFEVERDRTLVSIDRIVRRATLLIVAQRTSERRLDLDDMGAHAAEDHGAQLTRRNAHELEDSHTVEWTHDHRPPVCKLTKSRFIDTAPRAPKQSSS